MQKNIVLMLLLLAACNITRNNYNDKLQTLVGADEYQLYQMWGQPHHVFYISPTEKVWTYVTSSDSGKNAPYQQEIYYQGLDEDTHWWDRFFGPPKAKQPAIYYCQTSFVIQNRQVISYNFNGDDCVSNN